MIDDLYISDTGDDNDSLKSTQELEDTMVLFIQEYCHANGYYLSKLEILKL